MKSILIVDDSSMMRLILTKTLEPAGYKVFEAVDGLEAFEKIKNGIIPNLIICDINMPNLNGIEFVRKIKTELQVNYIPIIMLTTETSQQMKEEGKSVGVKAWMVKPFEPTRLLSAVEKLIS